MVTIIVEGDIYHKKKYYFKKLLKEMGIKYIVSLGTDNPIWQSPIVKVDAKFEREEDVTINGAFTITPDTSEHAKRIIDFLIKEMRGYSDIDVEVKRRVDEFELFVFYYKPNFKQMIHNKIPDSLLKREKENWGKMREKKLKEIGVTEEMLTNTSVDILPTPVPKVEEKKEGYVYRQKKERRNLDAEEFKEETRKFNEARASIKSAILFPKKKKIGEGNGKIKIVKGEEVVTPITPPLIYPERYIDPSLEDMKKVLPIINTLKISKILSDEVSSIPTDEQISEYIIEHKPKKLKLRRRKG